MTYLLVLNLYTKILKLEKLILIKLKKKLGKNGLFLILVIKLITNLVGKELIVKHLTWILMEIDVMVAKHKEESLYFLG